MKSYYQTSQPDVIFDTVGGFSFLTGTRQHEKMLAEIQDGVAQLLPWPESTYADKRRVAYNAAGLTSHGALEAVLEFLGTLPNKPDKFAQLWEKREEIRAQFPKQ